MQDALTFFTNRGANELFLLTFPISYSLGYMPIHSMRQSSELASLNTATISGRFRTIKLQWNRDFCSLVSRLESFLSGPIGTGTRKVCRLAVAFVKLVPM